MKDNAFIKWIKQLHGKVNTPILNKSAPAHLAFLRNLEKEMETEKSLYLPLEKLKVVVFDFETTGFYPEKGDHILSIGAIKLRSDRIEDNATFYSMVHFDEKLTTEIRELTGLEEVYLQEAPPISEVLWRFYQFVESDILVAHHASHEKRFLQSVNWRVFKRTRKHRIIDTSLIFALADKEKKLVTLEDYCLDSEVELKDRHHALGDAVITAKLWQVYTKSLAAQGYSTLKEVYEKLGE